MKLRPTSRSQKNGLILGPHVWISRSVRCSNSMLPCWSYMNSQDGCVVIWPDIHMPLGGTSMIFHFELWTKHSTLLAQNWWPHTVSDSKLFRIWVTFRSLSLLLEGVEVELRVVLVVFVEALGLRSYRWFLKYGCTWKWWKRVRWVLVIFQAAYMKLVSFYWCIRGRIPAKFHTND